MRIYALLILALVGTTAGAADEPPYVKTRALTMDSANIVAIKVGGYMYGAVGVSGAPMKKKPGDLDDQCARTGIKAIQEQLEFAS